VEVGDSPYSCLAFWFSSMLVRRIGPRLGLVSGFEAGAFERLRCGWAWMLPVEVCAGRFGPLARNLSLCGGVAYAGRMLLV